MGAGMARIVREFEQIKFHFGEPQRPQENYIALPHGYGIRDDEQRGISDGEIAISK